MQIRASPCKSAHASASRYVRARPCKSQVRASLPSVKVHPCKSAHASPSMHAMQVSMAASLRKHVQLEVGLGKAVQVRARPCTSDCAQNEANQRSSLRIPASLAVQVYAFECKSLQVRAGLHKSMQVCGAACKSTQVCEGPCKLELLRLAQAAGSGSLGPA